MYDETKAGIAWVVAVVFLLTLLIAGGCYAYPKYNVYSQTLQGRAELARAESNRKIAVAEAQAKMESAQSLAQAEIERAKGVAQANKIIGDSLRGNDEYLRYLWIDGLQTNNMQVVYIPTEAGLPILEAGATNWRQLEEATK